MRVSSIDTFASHTQVLLLYADSSERRVSINVDVFTSSLCLIRAHKIGITRLKLCIKMDVVESNYGYSHIKVIVIKMLIYTHIIVK